MNCGNAAHQGGSLTVSNLTADAQALNQGFVPFRVTAFQVFQQAAPTGHHGQQPTAGMMILGVSLEMILELFNALAEDGYLNLWRAGVGFMDAVIGNHLLLGIGRQGHARIDTPRLTLISFLSSTG